MSKEVPEEVMTITLISAVNQRPVLLTSEKHIAAIERHVESILGALWAASHRRLTCHRTMEWDELEHELNSGAGGAILLSRVDRLPRVAQTRLGEAFREGSPDLQRSAVVMTAKDVSSLEAGLCCQVLASERIDLTDDRLSMVTLPSKNGTPSIGETTSRLHAELIAVKIVPELVRYMMDIIIFIRAHRLVRSGIHVRAKADFHLVTATLCAFHGMTFATPQIIKSAARMTLPVKIKLCEPRDEPSLQYGSNFEIIREWMQNWDSALLVDSVLDSIFVPK